MDTSGANVVTSVPGLTAGWYRHSITFTATSTTSRIIIRDDAGGGVHTFYVGDVSGRCIDIDFHWQSRDFDYGDEATTKFLREFVPFCTYITGGSLLFTLTYDKSAGGTSTDYIAAATTTVDWTSLDWASIDWSSSEEVYDPMNFNQDAFRTHSIYITASDPVTDFRLNKIQAAAKAIGKRWW